MPKSIYLINPRSDAPSYYGGEAFAGHGMAPTISIADLATPTVAGLIPSGFAIKLCDENRDTIDLDAAVDYVAITGKVSQSQRMRELADAFRRRGATVVIGGPYASLDPDAVRPHCDILVRGELEELAPQLFGDLQDGRWKDEYQGNRPDLSHCSLPRWDLYPNADTLVCTLQTSRGCPFECEFCDVIEYLGRRQRHKSISQVLLELQSVYGHGYRHVFLADDNLTVYRNRAKELLCALHDWNTTRENGPVHFYTQVSIDAARDEELLRCCAAAPLRGVFIGLETSNASSLKEVKKRQNINVDIKESVTRFVRHGIAVTGGMIVGFDSDHRNIFDDQFEFAMSLPVPIFTVGALVAPASTPIHRRLLSEGRLLMQDRTGVQATPWYTNIQPRHMSRDELVNGLRGLCRRIYDPSCFTARVLHFIDLFGSTRNTVLSALDSRTGLRPVQCRAVDLLHMLPAMGAPEARMWRDISGRLASKPEARDAVAHMLLQYIQIRYMYRQGFFWESPEVGTTYAGDVRRSATLHS